MNRRNIKRLLMQAVIGLACIVGAQRATAGVVADEGAWCWFADPRALHYENATGTINATYVGYIDVHGNVKATQYDWVKGRKTDVLVRSYFQPDDHNNPTFLVLPDERVMIFYTRHTDEACIWYRVSTRPGDITSLGDEKRLATANNTTYPSPFIMSDDPQHIYLCWRGINWHPTIARLTMPDEAGNCKFDFGPKQIVQSTGTRPYAKYQSNGKDKIYVSYTTGHPDNEMPDWLYLNVIDINKGKGPILRDLNGKQLSVINNGVFQVNKTDDFANKYPATIVDKTAGIRNWVWQIALDKDERPVVAYPHIDNAKTTHVYWYARWNGTAWKNTWVQYGGHAFHHNWNSTERCYSGGMAIDPDNINDLYLSIPTKDGRYNKDGVYELWRYTIGDDGKVSGSEQLTTGSAKNNARPYVIPGSKNSPLRLVWMNGDYYYWMVNKNYPKGYPTAIHGDHDWQETVRPVAQARATTATLKAGQTLSAVFVMDANSYGGTLISSADGSFSYTLDASTHYPQLTVGGKTYRSQNCLLTSDDWAYLSSGTSGDRHPTMLKTWVMTMTYDGETLTIYRNDLVDQVVSVKGLDVSQLTVSGTAFRQQCYGVSTYDLVATPEEVKLIAELTKTEAKAEMNADLPTSMTNGDFEGSYAPMTGSGVSSDRAIYLPQGWTISYTARNENDLTALKSGDKYFSNFFASRPVPASNGKQTYWIRQNWGASTITLGQELLLPAGNYRLTTDVWKSGLGGDAYLQAVAQDGATKQAPTVENKEEWQQMSLCFASDGKASTTIALVAMHNSNGNEKIIGFDNVKLVRLGDVDGDGSLNVVDVVMLIGYLKGGQPDGFLADAADADADGTVDADDVVSIIGTILADTQ